MLFGAAADLAAESPTLFRLGFSTPDHLPQPTLESQNPQATPIATTTTQYPQRSPKPSSAALPSCSPQTSSVAFWEKRQDDSSLLWGVVVEAKAYSQDEPACHGYRR